MVSIMTHRDLAPGMRFEVTGATIHPYAKDNIIVYKELSPDGGFHRFTWVEEDGDECQEGWLVNAVDSWLKLGHITLIGEPHPNEDVWYQL